MEEKFRGVGFPLHMNKLTPLMGVLLSKRELIELLDEMEEHYGMSVTFTCWEKGYYTVTGFGYVS